MRDANGRFLPKDNAPANDNDHLLQRVLSAWHERRFDIQLATRWKNCGALFKGASEQQRAVFRARLEEHTNALCAAMAEGASETTLLAMAGQFYTQCLSMPRTAPPPPTPKSERERVERDLCNGQYHKVPYVGPEMDALEFILSQEPPETRIERFDVKSITLSSGRVIQRRELREYYPTGTTRLENGWYRMFPNPASYESDIEPGRVPIDKMVTVIRE
jgi:hypothetical protein